MIEAHDHASAERSNGELLSLRSQHCQAATNAPDHIEDITLALATSEGRD